MYNNRKFGQSYKVELKIHPMNYWYPRRSLRKNFSARSYKQKLDAGQSSISMLKDVQEVEEFIRRSRAKIARSLRIK